MEEENVKKLESTNERVSKLEISDAEQEVEIRNNREHIKRIEANQEELEKAIEPLKQHMIVSSALIKAVSVLGAIIGVILGIIQIVSKLK